MTKDQLKITRFLRKNGMTQKQLAEISGWSVQCISDWVTGKNQPHKSFIILLKFLQKNIDANP